MKKGNDIIDTVIRPEDLNVVDMMNSSAIVSKKGDDPVIDINGDSLKGALMKYSYGIAKYNEMQFIKGVRNQIMEYLTERFNYENLPEGLDKYRIESKVIHNGAVAIIKVEEVYYALNFTVVDFDIYDQPRTIQIIEPKSNLNGRVYNLEDDVFAIIRNTVKSNIIFPTVYRYINILEKTLYQLEKNIHSSAPKGIINIKDRDISSATEAHNQAIKNGLENIVNGADTYYVMRNKPASKGIYGSQNDDNIFIPMQFDDRSESLIRTYNFIKEQLKETIGAIPNVLQGKKERNVTAEIDSQDSFAVTARQHGFNVRTIDVKNLNKVFGLNVIIEYQSDDREESEGVNPDNAIVTIPDGGDK